MNKIIIKVITGLFVALMMSTTAHAGDDSDSDSGNGKNMYKVTITNLTQAQKFTPVLVASSKKPIKLFTLGMAASPALTDIAERGDVVAMTALLIGANPNNLVGIADSGGLLDPGASVTVTVSAKRARYISLASMLIPTNDAFFALNGVRVKGRKSEFWAPAYDAGTETNDEDCDHIPGPACSGPNQLEPPDSGEGYVYIHGGIHGLSSPDVDLAPEIYDWRNPVAHVEIVRVK